MGRVSKRARTAPAASSFMGMQGMGMHGMGMHGMQMPMMFAMPPQFQPPAPTQLQVDGDELPFESSDEEDNRQYNKKAGWGIFTVRPPSAVLGHEVFELGWPIGPRAPDGVCVPSG